MQALHWLTGLEELNKKPEAGMASGSPKVYKYNYGRGVNGFCDFAAFISAGVLPPGGQFSLRYLVNKAAR